MVSSVFEGSTYLTQLITTLLQVNDQLISYGTYNEEDMLYHPLLEKQWLSTRISTWQAGKGRVT
jgi:hypothetical protein